MRRHFVSLAVIAAGHVFAGSTDSTEAFLRTEGRTTRRVDALLRMGFSTYESPAAENTAYWREAQQLSEEMRYKVGLAHAPMEGIMRDFRAGHYAGSIAALERLIARLDSMGIDQDFLSPLGFIRINFNAAGNQAARLAYFTAALKRYEGGARPRSLAVTHHALAGYYSTIRQYGTAIEHYMKARDLFMMFSPDDAINETMVIGWAYERWGNPQRAIPYLIEALRGYTALGDKAMQAEILMHLADDELGLGDTLSAHRDIRASKALWHALDSINAAIMRSQYVQALLRMGEREAAHDALGELRAICAAKPVPLTSHHGVCEVDFCGYLFHLEAGEFESADSCLRAALAKAERMNEMPLLLKYRKAFMRRLLDEGKAAEAAWQAAAYVHLNDSLQAVANAEAVAAYEGQVQERESAMEIQRQQARVKQQRVILIATAAVLLLLVALVWSIHKGKKRSDELLLNILPAEVAAELKSTGTSEARHIEQATILFTDFKGFTEASEVLTPQELVEELDVCFKAFDAIITAHGIEKIKTIGDAYMAAGGLQRQRPNSVADVVLAALDMQDFMVQRKAERSAQGKPAFEMRVGVHTGPVVAGIVGVKKFQYDIWGDTVNTASRMESSGEVGCVNISESTYREIASHSEWSFVHRGKVKAKGKGELEMYFVSRSLG